MVNKFYKNDFKLIYEHLINMLYLCKNPRKAGVTFAKLDEDIQKSENTNNRLYYEKMRSLITPDIKNFIILNYPVGFLKFSICLDFYIIPITTIFVVMVYTKVKYIYGFYLVLTMAGILFLGLVFKIFGNFVIHKLIIRCRFYKMVKERKIVYSD